MSWYEELDKWAADYLPDMEYEKDAPLVGIPPSASAGRRGA